jgi:hypothetical protein
MIGPLQQFAFSLTVVFACAVHHVNAATIVDDFSDGGVVLDATEEAVLHDSASSAIGGWRAISFLSNPGSSTLTIDDDDGTLGTTTTGLTSTVLGYGYRVDDDFGLIGTAASALNADLSGFVGLRFHILENPVVIGETRMRLEVMLSTSGGGSSSTGLLPQGTLPASGIFDLPFASIPATSFGGVDLSDVDRILITIRNGLSGNPLTIGRIELVPEPAALALGVLGGLALFARPKRLINSS